MCEGTKMASKYMACSRFQTIEIHVLYYTPCDEEKENSCKKLCDRLCAVGSYLSHLQAMHVELPKMMLSTNKDQNSKKRQKKMTVQINP